MSPYMLLQNNIPVVRCIQRPGEFIINYPGKSAHAHLLPSMESRPRQYLYAHTYSMVSKQLLLGFS